MGGSTAKHVVMEAVGDGHQAPTAKLVVRTAPRGPHNDKFGGPARTPDPGARQNDYFGGSPTRCPRSGDESRWATCDDSTVGPPPPSSPIDSRLRLAGAGMCTPIGAPKAPNTQ